MTDDDAPMPDAIDAIDADIVTLEPEPDEETREDITDVLRFGTWIVPVALVHLALLYWLVSAATGFTLPRALRGDLIVPFLWVNGGLLAAAIWMWRNDRFPIAARKWLTGRRARLSALLWLAGAFAWFILPEMVGETLRALRDALSGW